MIGAGTVLIAGAIWRTFAAVAHYQASLTIVNDPSMQELEQVGVFVEGGLALLLLIHGIALVVLSWRPIEVRWSYAGAAAITCTVILGATLLSVPVFSWPGVYPAAIVASIFFLSRVLPFGWISLYFGAVVGTAVAWSVAAPAIDPFACLAVAVPGVALAFFGAGLQQLRARMNSPARN